MPAVRYEDSERSERLDTYRCPHETQPYRIAMEKLQRHLLLFGTLRQEFQARVHLRFVRLAGKDQRGKVADLLGSSRRGGYLRASCKSAACSATNGLLRKNSACCGTVVT